MNSKIFQLAIFALSYVSSIDYLYTEDTIKAFGSPTPNCFKLNPAKGE